MALHPLRAIALRCLPLWLLGVAAAPAIAQDTPPVRSPMTVTSDLQEANSTLGIVTARGNVRVDYPARQLQGTAAQAQYFSNERRLIMAGDVLIIQDGNTLRAETVTYWVDEGRTLALPLPGEQVEAVYLVTEAPAAPDAAPTLDESLLNTEPGGDRPF
ncbi:MAG: hypothetical protein MH825_14325 [Cyanobacteria bacterium]|nr:hypothetical protein [Cyanobacteriota bacterium]